MPGPLCRRTSMLYGEQPNAADRRQNHDRKLYSRDFAEAEQEAQANEYRDQDDVGDIDGKSLAAP